MHCIRSLFAHVKYLPKRRSVVPCPKTVLSDTIKLRIQAKYFTSLENERDTEDNNIILETIVGEICKGNQELEKKLRILMLEVEVMRQDGRAAPSVMKKDHWEHLLELPSRSQRINYLLFLWKIEISKNNQKMKKEAKRKEYENTVIEEHREYPDDLLYGLKHQSLFLRIRDQSMNHFDNYRAIRSMRYGQQLVIDCSYEEHMIRREIVNAALQVTLLFGDNRIHKDPFDIHMCNVNPTGVFMKQLKKNIPLVEDPGWPLNIHCDSYLNLFPRDKLVYLTPHCNEELTHFDSDAIYIVGCMVDKINNEPLSLAKAKRDRIKMAKLPLDRYLEWAPGAKKNLNINHMIPILLDARITNDWEYAFRHVPRRKLMSTKIEAMQRRMQKDPSFKDEVNKNYRKYRSIMPNIMKDKQRKSKQSLRSLYDDDSI